MGKRIVVCDDDPVVGILVHEYLKAHGHDITVMSSGTTCLAQLEAEIPDILILDLIMPDMTGIDVLRKIRANPAMAKLPVIMMSANTDTGSMLDGYEVAADCYVEKPFDLNKILLALESLGESST